ncbi:hypothetical protein GCM10009608_09930 [Pseudonocardia alaniniphila]
MRLCSIGTETLDPCSHGAKITRVHSPCNATMGAVAPEGARISLLPPGSARETRPAPPWSEAHRNDDIRPLAEQHGRGNAVQPAGRTIRRDAGRPGSWMVVARRTGRMIAFLPALQLSPHNSLEDAGIGRVQQGSA